MQNEKKNVQSSLYAKLIHFFPIFFIIVIMFSDISFLVHDINVKYLFDYCSKKKNKKNNEQFSWVYEKRKKITEKKERNTKITKR